MPIIIINMGIYTSEISSNEPLVALSEEWWA